MTFKLHKESHQFLGFLYVVLVLKLFAFFVCLVLPIINMGRFDWTFGEFSFGLCGRNQQPESKLLLCYFDFGSFLLLCHKCELNQAFFVKSESAEYQYG
jgi:hypothetical protein